MCRIRISRHDFVPIFGAGQSVAAGRKPQDLHVVEEWIQRPNWKGHLVLDRRQLFYTIGSCVLARSVAKPHSGLLGDVGKVQANWGNSWGEVV